MTSDHALLGVVQDGVQLLRVHVIDWSLEKTGSDDEWDLPRSGTGAHKQIPELLGTRSVLVEEWKKLVLGWETDTKSKILVRSWSKSLARTLSWLISLEDLDKVLQRSSHGVTDVAVNARTDSSTSIGISVDTSFWLSVNSDSGFKVDVILLVAIETSSENFDFASRHTEALVSILIGFLMEVDSSRLV